jgi:hypothetical protein
VHLALLPSRVVLDKPFKSAINSSESTIWVGPACLTGGLADLIHGPVDILFIYCLYIVYILRWRVALLIPCMSHDQLCMLPLLLLLHLPPGMVVIELFEAEI